MLREIKKLLPQNQFLRGVGVLVGGTASSQLLMVMVAPLLTRLYSPEDYGLLAVYAGLLGLFSVVASLRYELAIPLPESDAEAAHIVILSLLIVLLMTTISLALVWLAGPDMASALGVDGFVACFWLLPVGVLFSGMYQVFNYWAIRRKNFSAIASTRIRQTLATLAVQLLGFKFGGGALLFGQTSGQGVGCAQLARSALRHAAFKEWRWSGVIQVAKRYRTFPIFSTWAGFFNTAGHQLPPLMFAAMFSAGAAGLYALAHRVLAMPMTVIGDAISSVFFANAAEAYREGRLGGLVSRVHEKLAYIAMPGTLLLMLIGPDLFAQVFGENWRQAGEFARWMAPWIYMAFITSPLTTLTAVMEKIPQNLLFQTVLLLSRGMAISVGAWYEDLQLAVILFSMSSALCYLGFLVWLVLITGNGLGVIIWPTLVAITSGVFCIFPLAVVQFLPDVPLEGILSACAFTLLLFSVYYVRFFRKAYEL